MKKETKSKPPQEGVLSLKAKYLTYLRFMENESEMSFALSFEDFVKEQKKNQKKDEPADSGK